jgi:hypothetical protein
MKAWNNVGFVAIAMSLAGSVGCSGAGYESDVGTSAGAGAERPDITTDRVAEVAEPSAAGAQEIGPAHAAAAPAFATASEKAHAETNDDSFPAMEDGAYCGPDSDCQSGNCVDGVCAPETEESAAAFEGFENGAYCGPDSDCKSGKCVDGVCG